MSLDQARLWGLHLQRLRIVARQVRDNAPAAIKRAMDKLEHAEVKRLAELMGCCGAILTIIGVDNEQPNG